ncbi:hypothetical protein ES703_103556 [subsurface metagenome]
MRALLIEWDPKTGKRAGDINPRDPKLQCYGWQDTDVDPALEIRLVEDDRDLSSLEGVKGVTILEGKEAINDAIDTYIPPKYGVKSEFLMREHMKEKGISLDTFANMDMREIAKKAHGLGLVGVIERRPERVK